MAAALAASSCGTSFREIIGEPYNSSSAGSSETVSAPKEEKTREKADGKTLSDVLGSFNKSVTVHGGADPLVVGAWSATQDVDGSNGSGKARDRYEFGADGTFSQNGSLVMKLVKEGTEYTYEIAVNGGGKYGVEDGKIYLDYDPDRASAELVGFDTRSADGKGNIDGSASNTIKLFTINPMKKSFLKAMKTDKVYSLESVSKTQLVITDTEGSDSRSQTFSKVE